MGNSTQKIKGIGWNQIHLSLVLKILNRIICNKTNRSQFWDAITMINNLIPVQETQKLLLNGLDLIRQDLEVAFLVNCSGFCQVDNCWRFIVNRYIIPLGVKGHAVISSPSLSVCDRKRNSGRNRNRIAITWSEPELDQHSQIWLDLAGFLTGSDISSSVILSNTVICNLHSTIL